MIVVSLIPKVMGAICPLKPKTVYSTNMKTRHHPYLSFCAKQRQKSLLRRLPKEKIYLYDFSSNDYLGFSQQVSLIEAAKQACDKKGVGATSSRLIGSHHHGIQALESQIANDKHSQAALVFATGFQANISVLSALLDPTILGAQPLVFCDKLNHASMHMACQLNHVKQHRYSHLDYDHLTWWLEQTRDQKRPRFILTESVFGMDGDVADLQKLIQLAKDYNAFLYVDEAHATGLFGQTGHGLTCEFGPEIDVSMGTFSKGLGTSGAYIACSNTVKRYLVNRCIGLIYSTAPAPMQIAAMQAAWETVPQYQSEVQALFKRAQTLRGDLKSLGFNTGTSTTHIIPIIFEQPDKTLHAQRILKNYNIHVSAIRPPSVPPHQSRLRIALTINHDDSAINALLQALIALK